MSGSAGSPATHRLSSPALAFVNNALRRNLAWGSAGKNPGHATGNRFGFHRDMIVILSWPALMHFRTPRSRTLTASVIAFCWTPPRVEAIFTAFLCKLSCYFLAARR
jgi:hypothetical protein